MICSSIGSTDSMLVGGIRMIVARFVGGIRTDPDVALVRVRDVRMIVGGIRTEPDVALVRVCVVRRNAMVICVIDVNVYVVDGVVVVHSCKAVRAGSGRQ
jgi:hypothetical protein